MKKIICTVTNDLTFDQRMIRICTSLANAGYEVQLVGRELPESLPVSARPFSQKRFKLFLNKGKFFYLEYNFRLFFFLLSARFDLVCSVDLDTLGPGFFVSKLRGKKCVYDAHEYFTEVPEVVERPMVKKTWEALAHFIVPKLKHAYTVCESLAVVFSEKYKTPFSVVRNVPFSQPLPQNFEEKNGEADPFILLYQGVLNDGRGLEEAIEAMKLMKGTVLWLAGEGDLSQELRLLVKKNGLEERVVFLGKVSPEALKNLTNQAHLGLNLLKNKGLNYYYSLANKAFDYIQAGIPSLSMDFPEYRRINSEHEVFYLLPTLNPQAIAEAVLKIREEKLYQKISRNCLIARQFYTWENEEKKLLAFYEAVFGQEN